MCACEYLSGTYCKAAENIYPRCIDYLLYLSNKDECSCYAYEETEIPCPLCNDNERRETAYLIETANYTFHCLACKEDLGTRIKLRNTIEEYLKAYETGDIEEYQFEMVKKASNELEKFIKRHETNG